MQKSKQYKTTWIEKFIVNGERKKETRCRVTFFAVRLREMGISQESQISLRAHRYKYTFLMKYARITCGTTDVQAEMKAMLHIWKILDKSQYLC